MVHSRALLLTQHKAHARRRTRGLRHAASLDPPRAHLIPPSRGLHESFWQGSCRAPAQAGAPVQARLQRCSSEPPQNALRPLWGLLCQPISSPGRERRHSHSSKNCMSCDWMPHLQVIWCSVRVHRPPRTLHCRGNFAKLVCNTTVANRINAT